MTTTDPSPSSNWAGWPNRISLLRLMLVAPFVVLMQYHHVNPEYRYWALAIFAVMGLSDMLDGYLARRMGWKSRLGAILDPLADKTLIICSALLLTLPDSRVEGAQLPFWVVVLIVGKDLWVIGGFLLLFLLTGSTKVHPTIAGKLSTAGQIAMVTAILLSPDLNRLAAPEVALGTWIAKVFWWGVGGLCVLAVFSYTRVGLAAVAEHEHTHGHKANTKA
jgi:cardiolipin synthase